MKYVWLLEYHYDCFNDIDDITLDRTTMDDWSYQFPKSFGVELISTGLRVTAKSKNEILERLAKEIKKPKETFNENGIKKLLSFAMEIAIKNPEYIL